MRLSRFIPFDLPSEARLVLEWAGIEARLRSRGRSRAASAALVLAPLAAAAAIALWLRRSSTGVASALDGAVFGSDTSLAAVALRDGSRIEVEPHARIAVVRGDPRDVRIELRGGAAIFEVVPTERRAFAVEVGGVEIGVIGSRFRVGLESESQGVRVAVERGAVEVRRRGHGEIVRRLAAGEQMTLRADATPAVEDRPIVGPSAADDRPVPTR